MLVQFNNTQVWTFLQKLSYNLATLSQIQWPKNSTEATTQPLLQKGRLLIGLSGN